MYTLKPLSMDAIPKAIEKAERYRLLNEPWEAESICLDVLGVDSENQPALTILLLALTDQFDEGFAETLRRAEEVRARLRDEYARAYYAGVISERRAKARLNRGGLGSGYVAYNYLRTAMSWYEQAETIRPPGNDDALLRWNTCARILMRHAELEPGPEVSAEPALE